MSGLASAVEELAGENPADLPDAVLADDLVELRRQIDRLEAQWLRRLAVFDARGGALGDGFGSSASWLRGSCRMAPGAARDAVVVSRALEQRLCGTARALADGEISYAHARGLARETEELPTAALVEAEPLLLETARTLDPGSTRRAAAHLRHVVDAAGAHADAERAYERRGFHLSETWAGMFAVNGRLDPETGALLTAVLMARAAPAGPDDYRTPAQRRADALGEMARTVLDAGSLPDSGGMRPHLNVSIDLPTLAAQAGARGAEVDWVRAPLTGEAARRLACDAAVVRVLTDGASEILDVGRSTRTVSPALRRALAVRDGGCVAEGCDVPPPWTDAHHILHWARGGPTCLSNLCLLCRRHHRLLHEGGWTVEIGSDRRPRLRRSLGPWRSRSP